MLRFEVGYRFRIGAAKRSSLTAGRMRGLLGSHICGQGNNHERPSRVSKENLAEFWAVQIAGFQMKINEVGAIYTCKNPKSRH